MGVVGPAYSSIAIQVYTIDYDLIMDRSSLAMGTSLPAHFISSYDVAVDLRSTEEAPSRSLAALTP